MTNELRVERSSLKYREPSGSPILFTPPVSDEYWTYRVRVADGQAIVAFPKFLTLGIGFAVEQDWNTNLPYTSDATDIYAHIEHNRGSDEITRERCVLAIELIQDAIRQDLAAAAAREQRRPGDRTA